MKMKRKTTMPQPTLTTKSAKRTRLSDDDEAFPMDGSPEPAHFHEVDSISTQARPYLLATAKLPISALQPEWSLGQNRALEISHARKLCAIFEQGGLNRRASENYLRVLCNVDEVSKMRAYLQGGAEPCGDGSSALSQDEVLSFMDWHLVNPRHLVELMAGQHRTKALELYLQQTGAGEPEAWWICEFYDRGKITEPE